MATIKSHTDLPQSKTLSKILRHESADMHYIIMGDDEDPQSMVGLGEYIGMLPTIPCWSLAALLKILKDYQLFSNGLIVYIDNVSYRIDSDNPVDTCVEMIIKLNKQKLI